MPEPDLFAEDGDGRTPLTHEERMGCKLSWITTRRDMNEAEYENVLKGMKWAASRLRRLEMPALLDDQFACELHKRMYRDVWSWAGQYRRTDRNLGVAWPEIGVGVRQELDNARYWLAHETFSADEIVLRTKHRLVAIHPFPNGNGRWSRHYADLLAEKIGRGRFSWGAGLMLGAAAIDGDAHKRRYIASLQAADNHEIAPLLEFARA